MNLDFVLGLSIVVIVLTFAVPVGALWICHKKFSKTKKEQA